MQEQDKSNPKEGNSIRSKQLQGELLSWVYCYTTDYQIIFNLSGLWTTEGSLNFLLIYQLRVKDSPKGNDQPWTFMYYWSTIDFFGRKALCSFWKTKFNHLTIKYINTCFLNLMFKCPFQNKTKLSLMNYNNVPVIIIALFIAYFILHLNLQSTTYFALRDSQSNNVKIKFNFWFNLLNSQ